MTAALARFGTRLTAKPRVRKSTAGRKQGGGRRGVGKARAASVHGLDAEQEVAHRLGSQHPQFSSAARAPVTPDRRRRAD